MQALNEQLIVDDSIYLITPNIVYSSALYEVIDYNRDLFSQFMAWTNYVQNESDTVTFLRDSLVKHREGSSKTYLIMNRHVPVGVLSFNRIDKNNKIADIGYWLDARAQKQGIMVRSINTLTKHYALNRLIKRFVIKCAVNNEKSNQVAQRCGFVYEGTLRQAEYLNQIFYDQNIYSLISPYI